MLNNGATTYLFSASFQFANTNVTISDILKTEIKQFREINFRGGGWISTGGLIP